MIGLHDPFLQELEARLPLRNVPFSLSRAVVTVEELPIRLDVQGLQMCRRSSLLLLASPAAIPLRLSLLLRFAWPTSAVDRWLAGCN